MHHILPTIMLVPLAFWFLARQFGARRAFYTLCWIPNLLWVLAALAQHLFGYGLTAHALFHFSYDTSYILTLIGLMFLLYLVFKKQRPFALMLSLLIAVVPLVELLIY